MSFEILFFLVFAGGWAAGRISERVRLPGVLGMTLWGVALSIYAGSAGGDGRLVWPAGFMELTPFIKSLALVVILLRAGLGLRKSALQKAGTSAILMAFIPCLLEGAVLTLLIHHFLEFPWPASGLSAFMLSAVSPAVVVPSMLELQDRGMGKKNAVITTILAGASVDDVVAISFFTFFLNLSAGSSGEPLIRTLTSIPLSLFGGLLLGTGLGFLVSWWFRTHHESIRATEKALLILSLALIMVQVGDQLHLAALLGVMAAGFVLLERSEPQARELSAKLAKLWVPAQIALFVIIGLSLEMTALLDVGFEAVLIIIGGLAARSVGVLISTLPSSMTPGERLFCVIAYIPKATVQAALGSVALSRGIAQGQTILAIAVLSIVFTAPLGLIGIRVSSGRLLNTDEMDENFPLPEHS